MPGLLIPVDSETAVVAELRARLTIAIGTRIPAPRPAEFGRVVGVGGVARDLVTDALLLTLEGFAASEPRAREICALMLAHLQTAAGAGTVGGAVCYGVRVVALPANLPMPSVPDRYRYTATVSADLRRVVG